MKADKIRLFLPFLIVLFVWAFIPTQVEASGGGGRIHTPFWEELSSPRFILGGIVALLGLLILIRFRIGRNIRTILLWGTFMLFGVFFVFHPTPIWALTKPVDLLLGGRTVPDHMIALLFFIGFLSLIGTKLFCGWVCPLGALQEITNRIPVPSGWKRKLPFIVTNGVRISIFILFLILIVSTGSNLFRDYNLDLFELFHWQFDWILAVTVGALVAASVFIYRPFCYLICPVGLLTWVVEHISLFRIRFDPTECVNCDKCIRESPCPAVKVILKGKHLRPDCFACGACINACPTNALTFRPGKGKTQD